MAASYIDSATQADFIPGEGHELAPVSAREAEIIRESQTAGDGEVEVDLNDDPLGEVLEKPELWIEWQDFQPPEGHKLAPMEGELVPVVDKKGRADYSKLVPSHRMDEMPTNLEVMPKIPADALADAILNEPDVTGMESQWDDNGQETLKEQLADPILPEGASMGDMIYVPGYKCESCGKRALYRFGNVAVCRKRGCGWRGVSPTVKSKGKGQKG